MDIVFDNYELTFLILKNLDSISLNTIGPVSQNFNRASKEMYQSKMDEEYIKPAKQLYETHLLEYTRLHNGTYLLDEFVNISYCVKEFINEFLDKKYWIALVNDIDFMEEIFVHIALIYNDFSFVGVLIRRSGDRRIIESELYDEVMEIIEKIKPYLYIEYPDNYDIEKLREFAIFKNVKKCKNMKRSKLISFLSRPS